MNAEQLFLDPLIEPSLHRKRSPSQPAIPPFLPEQGLLAAMASNEAKPNAAAMTKHSPKGALCSCEGKLFIVAYRGSPTKAARPVSPSHPEGGDHFKAADLSGMWMTRRRSKHSPIERSDTASSLVASQLLTL